MPRNALIMSVALVVGDAALHVQEVLRNELADGRCHRRRA
jgi:hypothetical protein